MLLRKTGLLILVLLFAWLGWAAMRPDGFHIERRTVIQAPPAKVFALLENFQQWKRWSPWEAKDPAMKREWSGPEQGVGAAYAWSGNSAVGAGRMEITQAESPSRLAIRLDFLQPFEAHNMATFTLIPEGQATQVTWAMDGPTPYVAKLIHTIFSMDSMVGPDFELGLAQLKTLAESAATP